MENQDSLTPTQYGKMVGMFPDPPHNPLPTGGYMDAGFDWVVHQAESKSMFGKDKNGKMYARRRNGEIITHNAEDSDYDDYLDELEEDALVLYKDNPSHLFEKAYPTDYEVGMNDYESYLLADIQSGDTQNSKMFDEDENLTPYGEKVLKEMYDSLIDESLGIEWLASKHPPSELLKRGDPIVYGVGLSEYQDAFEHDEMNAEEEMTYESMMGMVENLSDDDYYEFCYEMDIEPEDMEELSSFIMRNHDSAKVIGYLQELFGKNAENMSPQGFGAEEVGCDWVQIGHGNHPTKMSYIWYCKKLNAEIDSIKKPSRNRKVRPNSFTQNWGSGKQSHYFGAEMQQISDDEELFVVRNDMGQTKGFVEMEDDLEDESIEIEISDDEMNEIADITLDADFVKPSRDWFSLALGTAAVVIGGSLFVQNRSMFKADGDEMAPADAGQPSLVAHPSTGDLLPADYEEMIVESTGYAVPIIPVSLDPAFMGSRFHALPTDRTVESNEPGIGAHTDVAMTRDTDFREPEQSMITRFNADGGNCKCSLIERIKSFFTGKSCCEGKEVKEANSVTGQTPYFGVGFDGKNTQTRVIKETNPISLDPSTAPYIPQNLSGYTGQAYTPPTVYSDMMNIGVSGQNPAFVSTQSSSLQSVHGNLSAGMNQSYTDGSRTMSLSQWSIDYDVSQTSDSEAFAVSRSSGVRTMIRRV